MIDTWGDPGPHASFSALFMEIKLSDSFVLHHSLKHAQIPNRGATFATSRWDVLGWGEFELDGHSGKQWIQDTNFLFLCPVQCLTLELVDKLMQLFPHCVTSWHPLAMPLGAMYAVSLGTVFITLWCPLTLQKDSVSFFVYAQYSYLAFISGSFRLYNIYF